MWWDELQAERCELPQEPAVADYADLHQNSMTSSEYIVHAVTGVKYPYRLGTKDMLRFYIVVGNAGEKHDYKEACRFFYNTPEEFERYSGLKVSAASKTRFLKNQELFK